MEMLHTPLPLKGELWGLMSQSKQCRACWWDSWSKKSQSSFHLLSWP